MVFVWLFFKFWEVCKIKLVEVEESGELEVELVFGEVI